MFVGWLVVALSSTALAQQLPASSFDFARIDAQVRQNNLSLVGVPASQPTNFLTLTDKTANQNVSACPVRRTVC